jgi:hypothetical protein
VVYNFTGFTAGIDQFPRINQVLFGSDITFKFRLNGDHGMNIIESGYPKSEQIVCHSDVEVLGTDSTQSNNQGLTYHPNTDNYKYVWKTDPSWKGTCRQFVIKFTDGTYQRANFKFKNSL